MEKVFGVLVDRKVVNGGSASKNLLGIVAGALIIDQGSKGFDSEDSSMRLRKMFAVLFEDMFFHLLWVVD